MLTLKDFNEFTEELYVYLNLEFGMLEQIKLQEFKELAFTALRDTNIQHSIKFEDIEKGNE